MSNFKKAVYSNLLFATVIGNINIIKVASLSEKQLEDSLKEQAKKLTESKNDALDFLSESFKVDETEQLRFDIMKEIYLDKRNERLAKKEAENTKAKRQEILRIIESKKKLDLESKSLEELEAMLKDS